MTLEEFMAKMLEAFPGAEVGEDNYGQLVIYTGWYQDISEDNSGNATAVLVQGAPDVTVPENMSGDLNV